MAKCLIIECNNDKGDLTYHCQTCWSKYASAQTRLALVRLYYDSEYIGLAWTWDALQVNAAIDLELEMKENIWLDVPY